MSNPMFGSLTHPDSISRKATKEQRAMIRRGRQDEHNRYRNFERWAENGFTSGSIDEEIIRKDES